MQRRILSLLCVIAMLLGMITVPAFSTAESTLQEQVDEFTSGVITLTEDAENLTVAANTYIDLNGHSIAGVTVSSGVTLYVSDSQTDDYTVVDGIYGTVTGITGDVQAMEGYVAIVEEGVSFHRIDLAIKSMSLRPGCAGVYYTSNFAADEVVSAKVQSYGVALSVEEAPNAENLDTLCGYSVLYDFASGEKNGTLLTGIMDEANDSGTNAANAATDIYGRAYIKTTEGYVFGTVAVRNLQQQVEAIDAVYAKLTVTQKRGIQAMYTAFKDAMAAWNIPNLRSEAPLLPNTELRYCEHCKQDAEFVEWTSKSGDYIKESGHFILTKDVTISSNYRIGSSSSDKEADAVDVVIDLNGHNITSSSAVFYVYPYSTLSVQDSVGTSVVSGEGALKDGNPRSGGVFYLEKGNLNIYSGTYTLKDTDRVNNGGIVYSTSGALKIFGGVFNGNTINGKGSVFCSSGNFELNGGTVNGSIWARTGANVTLSGAAKVAETDGGLILAEDVLMNLGTFETGAEIFVSVDKAAYITDELTNANDYLTYIKPAVEGWTVAVSNKALFLTDGELPLDPNAVYEQAKAMDFTGADTEGKVTAKCFVCNATVEWLPLPAVTSDNVVYNDKAAHHFYLDPNTDYTKNKNAYVLNNGTTVCINLNGQTMETTTRAFVVNNNADVLNIMGEGVVIGKGTDTQFTRGVLDVVGKLNLYGGTYESKSLKSPVMAIRGSSSDCVVNMYEGTTIHRTENGVAGLCVYMTDHGELNMYGGIITGGNTSADADVPGGNIWVRPDTGGAKYSCDLNVYGGIISNGVDDKGGNIYAAYTTDNPTVQVKISGGEILNGAVYATGKDVSVIVENNPVVDYIDVVDGNLITVNPLTEGASIKVKANKDVAFTNAIAENAETYAQYFVGFGEMEKAVVKDNALVIADVCPHCGVEMANIQWTELTLTSGMDLTESGHFYLTQNYEGFTSRCNVATADADVVIDFRGHTVTVSHRGFFVGSDSNALGCTLSLMDTVGNGGVTTTTALGGGVLYVATKEGTKTNTLNVYGGTYQNTNTNARSGGCLYNLRSNLNIYGGTFHGTTLRTSEKAYGGNLYTVGGTTNIYGGTFIAGDAADGLGDCAYVEDNSSAQGKLNIYGGSLQGQVVIEKGAEIAIQGAPTLTDLELGNAVKIQLGKLTGGASIKVDATRGVAFTNEIAENAETYAKYFTTGDDQSVVIVQNNALVIDNTCPHCNVAMGKIQWKDLTQESSMELTETDHFYLSRSYAIRDRFVVNGEYTDIVIDFRGHTITASNGGFLVKGNNCTLNLMDTVGNGGIKSTTVGGDILYITADNGEQNANTLNVYGGSFNGQVFIKENAGISIQGAPVLTDLELGANVKIRLGELTEGTSIKVNATKGEAFTNVIPENAETYAKYFATGDNLSAVIVKDNALAIADVCPHCNVEIAKINWEELTLQSGIDLTESGHFYLNEDYVGFTKRCAVNGAGVDVVIDFRGHTIATSNRGFYVGSETKDMGCTLSLIDTVGNGGVTSTTTLGGGVLYAFTADGSTVKNTLNVYGGNYKNNATNPATGGCVYNLRSELNIYGGTFEGATIASSKMGGNLYIGGGEANIYGGTFTAGNAGGLGDCIYVEDYSSAQGILNVYGGTLEGQVFIKDNAEIALQGAPTLTKLELGANVKIRLGELIDGASINVNTTKGVAFTNVIPENAETYARYFTTDSILTAAIVKDNALVIADVCPHCGEERDSINWTELTLESGTELTESGHFRLTENVTIDSRCTVNGEYTDVVVDLNGQTITTSNRGFYVKGKGCTLSLMDTVGNGGVTSTTTLGGGVLYVTTDSGEQDVNTLNVYGGTYQNTATPSTGGCIYNLRSELNIYGGTFKGATVASGKMGGNLYIGGGEANIYGGTFTAGNAGGLGDCVYVEDYKTAGVLNIYGGTLEGQVFIKENAGISIQGAPTLTKLELGANVMTRLGKLTKGASIAVKTASEDSVFTAVNMAQYRDYFRAVDHDNYSISVTEDGALALTAGVLEAGFARVSVVPIGYEVKLGGGSASRITSECKDDIALTCVALREGGETYLICSMDFITSNDNYVNIAKEAITAATGVPGKNILMNATHTHSAPDIRAKNSINVTQYREDFAAWAAQAATAALEDLAVATVSYGSTDAKNLAWVRHYKLKDANGNISYAGSNFGTFTGKDIVGHLRDADTEMQLIRFSRESKDEDIVMMNFGSHATWNENATVMSADFPYYFRKYVEEYDTQDAKGKPVTGTKDVLCAYFIAAAGDQATKSRVNGELVANYQEHGEALGRYAVALLNGSTMTANKKTSTLFTTKTFTGQTNRPTYEEYQKAKELEAFLKTVEGGISSTEGKEALKQYGYSSRYQYETILENYSKDPTNSMELRVMSIGDLGIVFAPYEMFGESGENIKAGSPYEMTFIVSCAQGGEGYLPTEQGWEIGTYESHVSDYVRGTAETLVQEYLDLLEKLKNS